MKIALSVGISALLALVLAGCGVSSGEQATQVVARVNSDEITVHQLNYLLARMPNVTTQNADQVKEALLARLVDEQLVEQQAMKDKLDRNPDVLQALEFARTRVLTRAYLDRVAAKLPKPTDAEVKQYYAAHPELFAQRRVFDLDEITFTTSAPIGNALRDEVAKAHAMREITAWLKSRGIAYGQNKAARAAEEIPLALLPRLQAMKDGEIGIAGAAGGHYDVVQLVASQAAPVDEATATPRIRQYLFNRRASEAIEAEIKRLRGHAKITYVGEFAKLAEAAPKAAPREPPAPANSPSFEKGVQGLLK